MSNGATFRSFPDDFLASPDRAEQRVLDFWRKASVFEEQQRRRRGARAFVFYEGPPTANGRPGIHHVFSRAIKDAICRYRWMMGDRVERKAGWDTHGLPVELEVEKKLGISGKKQIDDEVGVARFNELCRASVFAYLKDWRALSERIAYWLDYDHPYVTYEASYIESVWYLISRFHAKGLLEKRFKVLPYCPRCGTGLSSHEVGLGYRDVQDPSVTVRFPLRDDRKTSLLVWTTTPWTLPSNAAAAVHPEMEYVRASSPKHPGETFWLLRSRVDAVVPGATVLEAKPGAALVGLAYEPPFKLANLPRLRAPSHVESEARVHRVLAGSFVTSEDGTGIVHMAPCYGADDYELGAKEGLPILAAVARDGRFALEVGRVAAGTFFKDADAGLIHDLHESGRLFHRATVQHSYPFCWRCDTALLYYATPAWYLKTTAYRDRMVEENRRIRWAPPEIGSGRFGEWLEGNVDWALSRDRYWGTPLPVWECEACATHRVVESFAELRRLSLRPLPEPFDPHRPIIDDVEIPCGNCGKPARRSRAVIDCWFDSGAMPFAQHGWPFTEVSRRAVNDQFPADFIAEGIDQTRGWFYTLHAIATFMSCVDADRKFEEKPLPLPRGPAYRACVVNGLVLDAQGRKMSKRLGDAVDPFEAVAQHGADAVRLLLLGSGGLHLNRRFDADAISSLRRQVVVPLVNCQQFFALYANEASYVATKPGPAGARTLLDRWIRSRASTLAHDVGTCLDAFDLPGAVAAIARFADGELSNWYVRRNRRRFHLGDRDDRLAALETLRDVLGVASRCLAPLAPFFAEMLWHRNHRGDVEPESVHLQPFPTLDPGRGDDREPALERAMEDALVAARLARAMREKHRIRTTIPLASMRVLIPRPDEATAKYLEEVGPMLADEVNVDRVEFVTATAGLAVLRAKPNFPVLGKRAGKAMRALTAAIETLAEFDVERLRDGGRVSVIADGATFELGPDDVRISAEPLPGLVVESDGGLTVALDVAIDDERKSRGLAREFARAVNQARKDAGFELSDRCRITIADENAGPRLVAAIKRANEIWLEDVRAAEVRLEPRAKAATWSECELLEGENVSFRVERS